MTSCYLDASAIVKLATLEAETEALRAHVRQHQHLITSRLATVEVPRALLRRGPASVDAGAVGIQAAFEHLQLVELDEAIARTAADLMPDTLRSLDAIHLASALAIGDELAEFITYGARLATAARAAGLEVGSPGLTMLRE